MQDADRLPAHDGCVVAAAQRHGGTAEALRAPGLPVEVVGLGGLLDEPEIADLVATLRVLVDPTAGAAADPAAHRGALAAGGRRPGRAGAARQGVWSHQGRSPVAVVARRRAGRRPGSGGAGVVRRGHRRLVPDRRDLGPWLAGGLLAGGLSTTDQVRDHLQRLRARMSQPLPDLIADLERATGLDIEVQLGSPAGRAHLDAFADVVADVAATGAGPQSCWTTWMPRPNGRTVLLPARCRLATGRVQVLTVHAAKGLEWEIVAVPHLTEGVFPITRGSTWLGDAAQLPPSIRGDRDELPQLTLPVRRRSEGPRRCARRARRRLRGVAADRGAAPAVRRAHQGGAGAAAVRAPLGGQHHQSPPDRASSCWTVQRWSGSGPSPTNGRPPRIRRTATH